MTERKVFYSTQKLTARMRQRIAAITPAVLAAEQLSGKALVHRAKALSSGFLKTKTLAAMGHPYRYGGDPPIDPSIINAQAGSLRDQWQFRLTFTSSGSRLTLFNTSGHARFMLGTDRMIPRPILHAVARLEEGARFQRLRAAKTAALKK